MENNIKEAFLALVRLGIGYPAVIPSVNLDWTALQDLAVQQGLNGVVLDGVENLPFDNKPGKKDLLQWIGEVLQEENNYAIQQKEASEMGLLFHNNYIRTYVLKGEVVAECYPKPEHRSSVDIDCYLLPERGEFDAWSLGNDIAKTNGFEVSFDFYKNSTFYRPGFIVENHKFFTPFRGNKKLEFLEIMLHSMMKDDKGEDRFEGVWLYHPPVMVTALFLIEHAYSHFLHEGLTWRHVLDWMMFSNKHKKEIDWFSLDALIDEFGFRKFYNSFYKLGKFLIGEVPECDLTKIDNWMLEDIWAELTLPESGRGLINKLSIARNTLHARWKYRYFAEISMLHALFIQVRGFFFIKNPTFN